MRTRELDEHIRFYGGKVWAETPEEIVYINPVSGRVTVVPRRPQVDDWFADDVCFQLEIPKPSEVPVRPRHRSPRE